MKRLILFSTALAAGLAPHAGAQEKLPAIRPLGAVMAATKDSFNLVGHVRALSTGRVLVNDPLRRQVKLLDADMNVVAIVADSTSSTANAYGPRPGGLVAWKADSTLFVDPASLSILVLDPAGKIARVMSVPRPDEVNALTSVSFGSPGLDAQGRLIYRANANLRGMMGMMERRMAGGAAPAAPPEVPDTAAIVRLDLATRKLDTIAWYKVPRIQSNMSRDAEGRMTFTQTINPLPVADEWVVTADGRLAVLRSSDYHVDFLTPDGTLAPAAKVPFEWQRLTDEDKVALIDSVKAMRERMVAQQAATPGGGQQITFGGPGGGPAAPPQINITMRVEGGAGGPTRGNPGPIQTNIVYVTPSELPDYKPPFLSGAARADAEGNIWVRTVPTRQIPGGIVYDVINGKGELVERVQIPAGREIRAFGPGVAYMLSRDGSRTVIEAAKIR